MTDQIEFVCIRVDHQISTLVDELRIHDELWAYCPSARDAGHEWQPCATMNPELRTRILQRFPAVRLAPKN